MKIIDFEFAKFHEGALYRALDSTILGSQSYIGIRNKLLIIAPEILEGKERIGILAEVFSLGVLLYVMLYARAPFPLRDTIKNSEE